VSFKAVAFDLDGTLYSPPSLYAHCIDLGLRHARLLSAYAAVRKQLRSLSDTSDFRRNAPDDAVSFRRFQASLVARHMRISEESAAAGIDKFLYRDLPERFRFIRPYPGVTACLDALDAMGLPLGLMSDLPPHRKLELLGLTGRFKVALCAEDTGFLKPEKEPFEALAFAMGFEPDQVLYVGNKKEYDVAGAHKAGMTTAIVSRRPVAEADFSFFDWRDLVEWISLNR